MKTKSTISGRWGGRRGVGGDAACVITEVTEHAGGSATGEGPVTRRYLLVDQEPATQTARGRYAVDTPGTETVTCDAPDAP
jgi:hypothetical protein